MKRSHFIDKKAWPYINRSMIITVFLAHSETNSGLSERNFQPELERKQANSDCPLPVIECVSLCSICTPLSQREKVFLRC